MNPNAFYKCGYAIGLGKEIITLTDSFSNLPFDIRDRNAIEYKNGINYLENKLIKRISDLTIVNSS